MAIVVIRYETKTAARRALTFIVRIFVDDTIAITVWTSFYFHDCFSAFVGTATGQNRFPRSVSNGVPNEEDSISTRTCPGELKPRRRTTLYRR